MPYVFSTASSDTVFTQWTDNGGQVAEAGMKVLIRGGANVANRHFITPEGIATQVSDDELAFLEQDKHFIAARDAGYYTVSKKKAEVEEVVADMEPQDKSAPSTPADFIGEEHATPEAPKTAAAKIAAEKVGKARRESKKKK